MSSQAFRLGGRSIPLLKGAAVALVALSLNPEDAQAYVVTVNSIQYDVTTFTGDYNSNSSKFATPANGGEMPWWGSGATTWTFMQAVGANQGDFFANLGVSQSGHTILFAYQDTGTRVRAKEYVDGASGFSAVDYSDTLYGSSTIYWAQATAYTPPPAAPAPGPLPLFGAAAAFGFSRQLRKRIEGARLPIGSSQPLA
jgi:hypothetical protein